MLARDSASGYRGRRGSAVRDRDEGAVVEGPRIRFDRGHARALPHRTVRVWIARTGPGPFCSAAITLRRCRETGLRLLRTSYGDGGTHA